MTQSALHTKGVQHSTHKIQSKKKEKQHFIGYKHHKEKHTKGNNIYTGIRKVKRLGTKSNGEKMGFEGGFKTSDSGAGFDMEREAIPEFGGYCRESPSPLVFRVVKGTARVICDVDLSVRDEEGAETRSHR